MKSTSLRRTALASAALIAAAGIAPALATTASAAAPTTFAAEQAAGTVTRWAGPDRYAASANISKASFPSGAATVYIASGEVYTDALSGAPVAAKNNSPILLVASDRLPAEIEAELVRLKPTKIVVFGGTATITGAVVNQLKKLVPTSDDVTRVAGQTRYGASAKISSLNYAEGPDVAFIASGEKFPDALSGAPVAGMKDSPLLLVEPDNVPGVVKKELERLKPKTIVVLGGTSTIDEDTYSFLTRYTTGGVSRIAGADRYEASATISEGNFNAGVQTAYVASGLGFADALSGAPVAGSKGGPMLLVDPNEIPDSIADELTRLKPKNIVVLGGPASVSSGVETQLGSYLAP